VRRLFSTLIVIALLEVAPVAASADQSSYAERVDFAGAVWLTEGENTSTLLEIHVFGLDNRSTSTGPMNYKDPGIELFYTHRETDPVTGTVTETSFEGFSGGSGATFDFQRSLAGAEATFPLRLYGWTCTYPDDGGAAGITGAVQCEEIGEPTVEAHIVWTGVGPIVRDVFNDRNAAPPWFTSDTHLVQAVREARIEGTIAGGGLELADGSGAYGVLLRGKYHEHLVLPHWLP